MKIIKKKIKLMLAVTTMIFALAACSKVNNSETISNSIAEESLDKTSIAAIAPENAATVTGKNEVMPDGQTSTAVNEANKAAEESTSVEGSEAGTEEDSGAAAEPEEAEESAGGEGSEAGTEEDSDVAAEPEEAEDSAGGEGSEAGTEEGSDVAAEPEEAEESAGVEGGEAGTEEGSDAAAEPEEAGESASSEGGEAGTEEDSSAADPEEAEESVSGEGGEAGTDYVEEPDHYIEEPESNQPGNYAYSLLEWNESWEYADYSKLHEQPVRLYRADESNRKGIVVCVNAGHGTENGGKVKTLCHPDGTPKVTGGSTGEGEIKAVGATSGTTMLDGTAEYKVNLKLAFVVRDALLDNGYDVLMIRENNSTDLDNIARTVFANNNADCHIALHYNSTTNDAGFFYIGVPNIKSYRNMEPVASHWQQHNALGEALLEGMRQAGVKICGDGNIPGDLTQTSYSTVPSMDIEVGDRGSDYSYEKHQKIATGIVYAMNAFFGQNSEE